MKKTFKAAACVTALTLFLSLGAAATGNSSQGSCSSSPAQAQRFNGKHKSAKFCCMGMGRTELSRITGLSREQLDQKYPQQTCWQIAYKLGKLPELKAAAVTAHKKMLDGLVAQNRITKADADKMTADFTTRVAAIDGKNTVILGRPGFVPEGLRRQPGQPGGAPGQ